MAKATDILDKLVVKVMKREPDTRTHIAGSEFVNPGTVNHDGTEIDGVPVAYAVVPHHAVEHLKANSKHYAYGEAYLPDEIEKKK